MFKKDNPTRGLTLIELMFVVSIIGMLAAIGVNTAKEGGKRARDAERKSTLQKLSVYLELYKDNHNGFYPATPMVPSALDPNIRYPIWLCSEPGCNFFTYSSDWIPTLAPGYISSLPRDPLGGYISSGDCVGNTREYLYKSDGVNYSLLAFCSPETTWTCHFPPEATDDPFCYNRFVGSTFIFKVGTPATYVCVAGDPNCNQW